jgi:predicted HTH domain antitoxin
MHTLTTDDLAQHPERLLDDARKGQADIVLASGEPLLLTVPLGSGADMRAVLTDLAATLFDREQVSLGVAARVAGLSYSEMVDELGRRNIAVIRLSAEELDRELAALRG